MQFGGWCWQPFFEYRSFERLELAPYLLLKLAPPSSTDEDKRFTQWMYRDRNHGYENRAIVFSVNQIWHFLLTLKGASHFGPSVPLTWLVYYFNLVTRSCRHRAGEDGKARHPHSGPPPEAGAAVRGIREAADPKAQQRRAENSWEALPGSMDCQAAEDQPGPPHSHKVGPVIIPSFHFHWVIPDFTVFKSRIENSIKTKFPSRLLQQSAVLSWLVLHLLAVLWAVLKKTSVTLLVICFI